MDGRPIETDAVVIGAGPVGLFQVFELGLLDIRAHVVDALAAAGGQCIELYPDKPIYDIPALPVASGRDLAQRLLQQVAPFTPHFHLGQQVHTLQPQHDGRFLVATSAGTQLLAKVVVIAAGVGAFLPRPLKLDGIEAFAGRQLLHQVPDAAAWAGRHLVVVGSDDAAIEAACNAAEPGHPQRAASVTLMHRRDVLSATPQTLQRLQALREAGSLRFVAGQAAGFEARDGQLQQLLVDTAEGQRVALQSDLLLVLLGLSPKLGPVAAWGLAMERKQLVVDTARFETSVPGIFAVGDVVHYPGKRKLIVCGFHEATLAAYAAAERVFPGAPVQLQYTTTSPKLHRLLGVAPQE